ncbi:MAG: hypothetical protein NVS3B28_26820 [Candidatus Velthaea sp.]
MNDRAKSRASVSLGPRQLAIMEHLWKAGSQTPTDLHRALSRGENIAYTTIFTELSRLVQKGFVCKRGSEHKSVLYEATFSREEWVAKTVSSVLGSLMQSHGSATIHGFVELVADGNAMDALSDAIERRTGRKPNR